MTMPTMKNLGFNDGCIENRKASKPLIEKRRRARINYSLAELKAIVVAEKPHLPTARPPKLEKADILEMAVAYVKKMNEKQKSLPESDQNGYLAGFNQCLLKVCQFLDKEIDEELKSRLVMHLNHTANSLHNAEPSADDTSSSCSSNSRSQTPASVTSTEQMEYHSSSSFTDTEQEVPARTFSAAESSYLPCRSSDTYHHDPYAQARSSSVDSARYGLYRESSSSAMNGPLNLAKSVSPIRRDDQIGQSAAKSQLGFFNYDNAVDNCMWRPWNSKHSS